jgi:3-methyladenine DNA glycosylase AlkD
MYQKISQELNKLKDPYQSKNLQRFFKTGKGEYGEGDIFLGLRMAQTRGVMKRYFKEASLEGVQKLLNSKIHEYRMTGVLILVEKFKKADEKFKKDIFNFYLKNTKNINNWDLVDLSAPNIVGGYLLDKDRKILYKLSRSKSLWERRISVLATFMFIREKDFKDAIKISEILLNDTHDLIHKAVGWMLREVGKKDEKELIKFLDKHTLQMPRTMLRYSIERLFEKKRKYYLNMR